MVAHFSRAGDIPGVTDAGARLYAVYGHIVSNNEMLINSIPTN